MEDAALQSIRRGQIASGPSVDRFEKLLSEHVQRDHVISTSDMTNALALALRALGVSPGQPVATLAFSCLSTNAAISMVGAVPRWLDLDPTTVSMCPDYLNRTLTGDEAAVVLYHVAGYPAQTLEIERICRQRGVPLIEDCNNALGARYLQQPVGRHGCFSIYSFYPNRQINGFEGGGIACDDNKFAEHLRRLRRFGINQSSFRTDDGEINPASTIEEIGISASLSEIHAAVACVQFDGLDSRLGKTRENVRYMTERLVGTPGVRVVGSGSGAVPAYWVLLLMVDNRDQLLSGLKASGVSCSKLHQRNDVYTGFNADSVSLPGTSVISDRLLAVPCGWWLEGEDLDQIVDLIRHHSRG
jgi:perosamine synthetase